MRLLVVITSVALVIISCTTPGPKNENISGESKIDSKHPRTIPPSIPPIDLEKLSQQLSINLPATETGFYEKPFNDCQLPQEYRLGSECSTQYFTTILFRMRCRDSEGTVENVTNYELEPLVANSIQWNLGSQSGRTRTDSEGYGKIMALSPRSQRRQKFRLTYNGQIMGVSAGEVRQFVLPRYWCD